MAKRIQIILAIFLVLAGLRLYLIYRARHAPPPQPPAAARNPNFSADDYVVPSRLHAYDLKSAQGLDGKTVWVRAGNQIYYYPFTGGTVDFKHAAGLLPPLDKLQIKQVMQASAPNAKAKEIAPGVRLREQQVMAIFQRPGDLKLFAVPVGANWGGNYTLYIDDLFFLEDPHQLYQHWSNDIWNAIDHHDAKAGMNELQVSLALGVGAPSGGGDYGNRVLQYSNNGHPISVTFEQNRATNIQRLPR